MRILSIQPCFADFGGYFRSIAIAKSLAKKGHDVDLLISSKENSLRISKVAELPNLNIFKLPRLNFSSFINGKILRGILACVFIIFKKYDVIHIFESVQFETNIPLILCKFLKKKNIVLDIDEEWLDSPIYNHSNKLVQIYIKFCDLKLAPKFEFMTVTSDYLVDKFEKLGVAKVLKMINGVDLDQFQPLEKTESRKYLGIGMSEKIVLSFGNTYEGERAYLLFKTFEYIYNLDDSIRLYFNMDPRNFLDKTKIKHEIDPEIFRNIRVTGYINRDMLPYYMGASDIVLFLTGKTNSEKACFPVRIGSYLNGERVIATNRTDTEMCNTLTKFNFALIEDRPSELAEKIVSFLRSKQMREKLEYNIVKAKKELCWDNLADRLIEFYEEARDR